jgi:hypothetical protein
MGFHQSLVNLASLSPLALQTFLKRYKMKNYVCAMENYDLDGY